jgi:hypothetical protein
MAMVGGWGCHAYQSGKKKGGLQRDWLLTSYLVHDICKRCKPKAINEARLRLDEVVWWAWRRSGELRELAVWARLPLRFRGRPGASYATDHGASRHKMRNLLKI